MNWFTFSSVIVLGIALWMSFVFLAPPSVVFLVGTGIAGWQVGGWISKVAIKLGENK